jgi:hypothetical protein
MYRRWSSPALSCPHGQWPPCRLQPSTLAAWLAAPAPRYNMENRAPATLATMVVRCRSTATVGFRDNLADARAGLGKKRPSMLIMENSPDDEQIGKQGHDRPSCLCSPSAYVCGHYYYLLYCCCVKPTVGPAYVCGQNAIRWRRKKPYIMRGTQEEARHITADCC